MEFVERAFVDDVVYLDGNTFIRCSFEGCELRYEGGPLGLDQPYFKTHNRVTYGKGVDAVNNALTRFLLNGMIAQGGTFVDPNAPGEPAVPPKKDLG